MAHREPVRLEAGPLLAATAALLLLVSLFLDWFGRPGADEAAVNAWSAFEVHDLLLAAIALLALHRAASALGAIGGRGPQVPIWALGLAALVIVASQLLNKPPAAIDAGIRIGAWLALASAVLLSAAGLVNRVRVSIVSEAGDGSAAPTAQPPPRGTGPGPAGAPAQRGGAAAAAPAPAADPEHQETVETHQLPAHEWGARRER